jgi:hypothetical protein
VIKDAIPEEVFDFYNAIIAEKENITVEVKQLSMVKRNPVRVPVKRE